MNKFIKHYQTLFSAQYSRATMRKRMRPSWSTQYCSSSLRSLLLSSLEILFPEGRRHLQENVGLLNAFIVIYEEPFIFRPDQILLLQSAANQTAMPNEPARLHTALQGKYQSN